MEKAGERHGGIVGQPDLHGKNSNNNNSSKSNHNHNHNNNNNNNIGISSAQPTSGGGGLNSHSSQSQPSQPPSRYVGYPSTTNAFTVKGDPSPGPPPSSGPSLSSAPSVSSMRSSASHSVDMQMQDSASSPVPKSLPSNTQLSTMSPHHFSTDVNRMPDIPPRNRGHRRAHSEVAVRLPDDISFDRELGVVGSDCPTLSDEADDDLFSMYIDMDKFTGFSASSTQAMAATTQSGSEGGLTPPFQSTHHSRSVSMDGVFSGFQNNNSGSAPGGVTSDKPRVRHQHSQSMDGFPSIKPELLLSTAEASLAETKKAMSAAKLADLALIDPKRAKRIWANRQSAARSKERKMRYISELERKVQTLQTEATTLSAQLTMLQRDTTGLTNENSELKLRLQSMEQQVHLRDALNDALREEVQRLKLATGQGLTSGGHMMNYCTSSFTPSQPFFQTPLQSSHTYLAAQQLQQLHLQSQQSALNLRNAGTGSSQGHRDNLSEFSMTAEGLPISTSQEAGCNF